MLSNLSNVAQHSWIPVVAKFHIQIKKYSNISMYIDIRLFTWRLLHILWIMIGRCNLELDWIPASSTGRNSSGGNICIKSYTRMYTPTPSRVSGSVSLVVLDYGFLAVAIMSVSNCSKELTLDHDDVIKWKHCPRYWHFVRGIHRSPLNSPHKGQWRGALIFPLICAWINVSVNSR